MAGILWTDDAEQAFASVKRIEWDELAGRHGDEAVAYLRALDAYEAGEPAALAAFDHDTDTYGESVDDLRLFLNAVRLRAEDAVRSAAGSEGASAVAAVRPEHVRAAVLQVTLRGRRKAEKALAVLERFKKSEA